MATVKNIWKKSPVSSAEYFHYKDGRILRFKNYILGGYSYAVTWGTDGSSDCYSVKEGKKILENQYKKKTMAKKKKTGVQLSLALKPKKKRKKATKSAKKITNRGLLRSKITAQKKKIAAVTKKLKSEKKKETLLKKKLTKIRKVAKVTKPRKKKTTKKNTGFFG